jgi:hypothetical protein
MPISKHTQLPWAVRPAWNSESEFEVYPLRDGPPEYGDWADVCTVRDAYSEENPDESRANAELIVKAVNSYEANQALIAKLTEALERIREECNNDGKWSEIVMERMIERIELEAVSALSLAKSETPQ